jgi:hypothetical protein
MTMLPKRYWVRPIERRPWLGNSGGRVPLGSVLNQTKFRTLSLWRYTTA